MEVDYAMLIKLYGAPSDRPDTRYSPAECIGRTDDRADKSYRRNSHSTHSYTTICVSSADLQNSDYESEFFLMQRTSS
jgi:hypothetical protein